MVAAVGCKKKEATSTAPAGSGSAGGSGSATASGSGGGSADSDKPHRAGNCPSTVARSTTTAAVEGTSVVVTISSDDPEAVAAIQKRTDELIAVRVEHRAEPNKRHDQNGEHGGGTGMCPVYIPDGATAAGKRTPNGVIVSISAGDPAALKTEIDGRIQKAAEWTKANLPAGDKGTQGALGGGKADEGMNHSGKGDGKGLERKQAGSAGSGGSGSAAKP